MREIKLENGITLIALVITIIVLLILAVVTISSLGEAGIIKYLENTIDAYKKSEQDEGKQLQNYIDIISKYEGNTISFNIGSKAYYAKEGWTWEKWVNSAYNTLGAKISKNRVICDINEDDSSIYSVICIETEAEKPTSVIKANFTYLAMR